MLNQVNVILFFIDYSLFNGFLINFLNKEKWIIQSSPTTKVKKLIPKLPFEVPPKRFNIRGGPYHLRGPHTRLLSIAFSVSKLIELERIETGFYRAYETRQYTERVSHKHALV